VCLDRVSINSTYQLDNQAGVDSAWEQKKLEYDFSKRQLFKSQLGKQALLGFEVHN
jgi:hypothetical protein